MRRQIELLLTAVMFYTRIPCPAWVGHSEELLNKATIYFPVMGWVVGGVAGAVYWAAARLFGADVGLLLSIIASVLLTGAFHEDGFADMCDGFGGGWTREKILLIMKDSRLGTYGAVGLGLLLALKFSVLRGLPAAQLPALFVVAHALSRATAMTFVYTHSYARDADDDSAKAKPVAKKISPAELGLGLFFGLLPLLLLVLWQQRPLLLLVLLPLGVLKWYLGRYFVKWIGGYTGDCLGATQQLAEVLIYLFLLALV